MRILLVDDHALFRDGMASLLGAWGHEVVGQASNGEEAIALCATLKPDLVLLDVRMPVLGGVETARRLKAAHDTTSIVMLTASEDEDDLFRAIEAGAQGYLLKDLEAPQLRVMLDAVQRGEAAMTPATAARILKRFVHPADHPHRDALTERELQVLRLVTDGLRNREIATRLEISENTVKYHLKNILEKLHAESRAELVGRAMREGLVRDTDR
ncbi:MAG TPA: response regulator transcription factor [Candidatus Limnocylindria bacterium]